jgi:hypothetical protein
VRELVLHPSSVLDTPTDTLPALARTYQVPSTGIVYLTPDQYGLRGMTDRTVFVVGMRFSILLDARGDRCRGIDYRGHWCDV